MERIQFMVEGSSGNEYAVEFRVHDTKVNAYCTCPAGKKASFCKHRVAIMAGDVSNLVSPNTVDVARLQTLLRASTLEAAYQRFAAVEPVFEEAKKEFDAAKKQSTDAMYR